MTNYFTTKQTIETPKNFINHLDDWIEYLSLLLDKCDEKIDQYDKESEQYQEAKGLKIKYERQLYFLLNFCNGCNVSLWHNLLISYIYNNTLDKIPKPNNEQYEPMQDDKYKAKEDLAFTQIQKAMNAPHLFLLQGPPGTGKTTAIVEMILQMLKQNPKARILITSETHVAVDNAVDRLSRYDELLPKIMRYKKFSNSTQLENPKAYQTAFEDEKINTVWNEANNIAPELAEVLWQRFKNESNSWLAKNLTDKYQIIGVTCNQIDHLIDKLSEPFDLSIIDECSKATLPEWLMDLSVAKKCLLIGDHKQLPPTFDGDEEEVIEKLDEQQENLIKNGVIDKLFENAPDSMKGMLKTQFRMQPNIGEFISQNFYNNELQHYRQQTVDKHTNFVWLTYSTKNKYPKTEGQNKVLSNDIEANLIKVQLEKLTIKDKTTIAIITPYKSQKRLLNAMIKKVNLTNKNLSIEVDTVDAFQGREANIVFFSFVRNNGSARFYSDDRRLNVALSRAKDQIYLVGNINYLKGQKSKALQALCELKKSSLSG